jgi:cytochrome c biogenesis protein CcdA/thiol-disulfide isomerase/thioredoxin
MQKVFAYAGLVIALCLAIVPMASAQEEAPPIRAYLFYSNECPSCQVTRAGVIRAMYREYGQQLRIKAIDIIEREENYEWLVACGEAYGIPAEEIRVPALFIGDRHLIGEAIEEELSGILEGYAESGVPYPDVSPPEGVSQPTARFAFFFSPTCPHCQRIEEELLPQIAQTYGDQVQWEAYDTSVEENLRALILLQQAAGFPEDAMGSIPVIFVGDDYTMYNLMLGSDQAFAYLESALDWFLEIGGVDLPEWWAEMFDLAASPLPEETPQVPAPDAPPIHVAYFAEAGCSECGRVATALQALENTYPQLVVHEFDVLQDIKLNLCLSERLGVPEDQRHDAPAVFVGSDYLVGAEIQLDVLKETFNRYVGAGAPTIWESCTDEVEVPPPAPWWAVIVPGLIDGINPCAFATIVFFVSYLTLIERKGRDILMVGLAFTLGIFLSYLGFGMLLREVLSSVIGWVGPVLKPILNILTALLCVVLGVLSFADYRKARRGRTRDMALRLPDRLRRWINNTVRKGMDAGSLDKLVMASFVTGVVVSFIELTCTGQVYAPIILGLSDSAYRGRALLSLVVYCLAFVVPLIVVFLSSYFGTNSRQLGMIVRRHTSTVKLVTGLLFLAISVWLVYDVFRTWGVVAPLFT